MTQPLIPPQGLIASATQEDVRREASSRPGRIQRSPTHQMGHRKGVSGGLGPPPDFAVSAADWDARSGLPYYPTLMVNPNQAGPDEFGVAVPNTSTQVNWRLVRSAQLCYLLRDQDNVGGPALFLATQNAGVSGNNAYVQGVFRPTPGQSALPSEYYTLTARIYSDGPKLNAASYPNEKIVLTSAQLKNTGLTRRVGYRSGSWTSGNLTWYLWDGSSGQYTVGQIAALGTTGGVRSTFPWITIVHRWAAGQLTTSIIESGVSFTEAQTPDGSSTPNAFQAGGFDTGGVYNDWRTAGMMIWRGEDFVSDADIIGYFDLYCPGAYGV